ncbi:MAG: carbon monoxide dehydrogenase [Pseudodesulfovibrio sp.]|uniref:Cobyrinic acid ac-diamide synthase n=1 Tax=Pseudodesulfovibrio aespoeensis (strain ATCC 700646 / DSM 10631 / Aspo-2) TaxID=643562 RepID=E6VY90_PSEA9|nr:MULTISPECIES: ArsA-related P-loop ATPase [Pseudodesulfovibrio]MBU4192665.1 carbon monoxide dehydrogenase [Pseudomonadota bacterium]ADU61548.1 cobyrinic acid ac-diamide synthase [Pseudodesulfovibrio aespoeensis Aspo-2]MBU4243099.1 carbon monoxide dehydrogenase [Pseudomonadota bacterium]MBU4377488.1 carbon monoxide dehydrogenase [Pseudomonadota bacterium]MBU4474631.1 carbon monoxide dehydrogenase [Pseudomonadota bacterium]
MKIAFAGKGGVGKTSLAAWMADLLARSGHNVWMIDADTALSLGQASGLPAGALPEPLVRRADLVRERIHAGGFLDLNPDVGDLPETLAVDVPLGGAPLPGVAAGRKRLLVMGAVTNAGGGCACDANALLKAVLAHLVMDRDEWVLVDLEAGVEHLGRGTVAHVDGLVVVSEPSMRSLLTGAEVGRMARDLGLNNQVLVVNRHAGGEVPDLPGLPERSILMPPLPGLVRRQMTDASVLALPETDIVDAALTRVLALLGG